MYKRLRYLWTKLDAIPALCYTRMCNGDCLLTSTKPGSLDAPG